MPKLFSNQNKKFLNIIDKPERELNKFICENWNDLFPTLTFIASEFPLTGIVRSLGTNGRIDILAYNPKSKKFVIFELKRNYDKNITDQVADYRDYVQDNFSEVYLQSLQKYDVMLPKYGEINRNNIEIILIAKQFNLSQVERVKRNKEGNITLIKYYWFEDDLIFIDYINNDPDDLKVDDTNSKKINAIKNIVNQDPEMFEIERFFGLKTESKECFILLLNLLKDLGNVELNYQQTKIKIVIYQQTLSIIGLGGKTGRKAILQVNTDIDITSCNDIIYDDRYRGEGVKKKGSVGNERYEVFLRNNTEMKLFFDLIKPELLKDK